MSWREGLSVRFDPVADDGDPPHYPDSASVSVGQSETSDEGNKIPTQIEAH